MSWAIANHIDRGLAADRPAAGAVPGKHYGWFATDTGVLSISDGSTWVEIGPFDDATLTAALAAHLADTSDAHDASAISVADAGNNFTGTDVEAVLAELFAAISGGGVPTSRTLTAGAALTGGGDLTADRTFDVAVDGSTIEVSGDALRVKDGGITAAKLSFDPATQAELDAHVNDTSDAHDAAAISFSPAGTIAATDVQAAIEEVAAESSAPVSSVFGRTGTVIAVTGDYAGVVNAFLTGATQASRYAGATASGAPVTGTFATGDFVIARDGKVWVCTAGGSPGTWSDVSSGAAVGYATPSIALGAAAAAGAATTVIRSDSTIAAFDATNPSTQAFGDAAAVGSAAFAARRDHKHAMPTLSMLNAGGSSASGTPGTSVASVTAGASKKLVAWTCFVAQTNAANTAYTITITYTDTTTTVVNSAAATASAASINAGGIIRTTAGALAALGVVDAKDVKSVAVTTLGTGTGTRAAAISGVEVPV